MSEYKIIDLINNTYQVVNNDRSTVFFQGSLSDCDTYLSLKKTEVDGDELPAFLGDN